MTDCSQSHAPESSFLTLRWGCSSLPYFLPSKPKAPFLSGHQSKGSYGRGRAECWEMRLSVRTDRPSISQCPLLSQFDSLWECGKEGLGGTSCNWTEIPKSIWGSNLSAFRAGRVGQDRFTSVSFWVERLSKPNKQCTFIIHIFVPILI